MARILEREIIESKLKSIGWEYVSPNLSIINDGELFTFINNIGNEVVFSFDIIYSWLYDEDYIGCGHVCEVCLTPIC